MYMQDPTGLMIRTRVYECNSGSTVILTASPSPCYPVLRLITLAKHSICESLERRRLRNIARHQHGLIDKRRRGAR